MLWLVSWFAEKPLGALAEIKCNMSQNDLAAEKASSILGCRVKKLKGGVHPYLASSWSVSGALGPTFGLQVLVCISFYGLQEIVVNMCEFSRGFPGWSQSMKLCENKLREINFRMCLQSPSTWKGIVSKTKPFLIWPGFDSKHFSEFPNICK